MLIMISITLVNMQIESRSNLGDPFAVTFLVQDVSVKIAVLEQLSPSCEEVLCI